MIIDDRVSEHRRLVRDARARATANGHRLKPFEVDKRISTSRTDYEGTAFCRVCGAAAMTSTMHEDALRGQALEVRCERRNPGLSSTYVGLPRRKRTSKRADGRCYIQTGARRRYFDRIADAQRVAETIFERTGCIVGIMNTSAAR